MAQVFSITSAMDFSFLENRKAARSHSPFKILFYAIAYSSVLLCNLCLTMKSETSIELNLFALGVGRLPSSTTEEEDEP